MKNHTLVTDMRSSIKHPAFWAYGTWLAILTRYRRSFIGPLWMLAPPAMYMFGLGFFFGRVQQQPLMDFMAHLGLGFLVFRLVTQVVNDSASVLQGHAAFIMDGNTRLTDYTLRTLFGALVHFAIGLPLVLAVVVGSGDFQLAGVPMALLGLGFTVLTLVWVSGLVALFGARYPDIHEFMGSLVLAAFVLTPILWDASTAPGGTAHGFLMRCNPVYHFVEVIRAPLLGDVVEPLTYLYLGTMSVIGLPLWWLAYSRYSRLVPIWI